MIRWWQQWCKRTLCFAAETVAPRCRNALKKGLCCKATVSSVSPLRLFPSLPVFTSTSRTPCIYPAATCWTSPSRTESTSCNRHVDCVWTSFIHHSFLSIHLHFFSGPYVPTGNMLNLNIRAESTRRRRQVNCVRTFSVHSLISPPLLLRAISTPLRICWTSTFGHR